jgi:hypothetical protein
MSGALHRKADIKRAPDILKPSALLTVIKLISFHLEMALFLPL